MHDYLKEVMTNMHLPVNAIADIDKPKENFAEVLMNIIGYDNESLDLSMKIRNFQLYHNIYPTGEINGPTYIKILNSIKFEFVDILPDKPAESTIYAVGDDYTLPLSFYIYYKNEFVKFVDNNIIISNYNRYYNYYCQIIKYDLLSNEISLVFSDPNEHVHPFCINICITILNNIKSNIEYEREDNKNNMDEGIKKLLIEKENEMLEVIKQLESLSNEERVELFGYISLSAIFSNYPVGMIKNNLSYKKNINTLNNIEVGDIIKIDDLDTEYIVTYIQKNLNTTLHEDKSGTYHVTLPDNINIHMLNRHDGSVNVIDPRDLNITIIGHTDILTALL